VVAVLDDRHDSEIVQVSRHVDLLFELAQVFFEMGLVNDVFDESDEIIVAIRTRFLILALQIH
jgi:hypothetical protein